MNKSVIVLTGLFIGFGIAIGGFFPGYYYYQSQIGNRFVTVKGLAEKQVVADLAIWTIKFQSTGNELIETQKELDKSLKEITTFLTGRGFTGHEINVGRINTNDLEANPYQDRLTSKPRFILTQTVTVRSEKIENVAHGSEEIGDLISEGVIFANEEYSRTVSYLFTKLNEIKPEMLAEATKNAKEAANEFAKNSDSSVGKIKRANQGVFSILPQDAVPGTDEAANINKTVRVVSTIEYYLD